MEATLPSIRELTAAGDSLMWIVGPGDMASENTSRGIREPLAQGNEITIQANNWRFHLDAGQVNPEDRGNIAVVQLSRMDWGKRNGLAWTEGDPIGDWNNCPEVESIPGKHSGDWLFNGGKLPMYSLFENLAGGAIIYDFMEWLHPVEESDVQAALEFVARDLRARVPDENSLQ